MQGKRNKSLYQQENHIDLDSIIKDILRQWWVIILVIISAVLLSGTYKLLTYKPMYETSTTFAIGKLGFSNNLAYDNLNSAENVTTKFTQIVKSSILKKEVCEDLEIPSFNATVDVKTIESSNLMTLTVTAPNPRLAYRMIGSVLENTLELGNGIMDTVTIKVLMSPSIPAAPINPLYIWGTMKKVGILSGFLMVLLFALLSYFKDTVKNVEEAKRKIDTKLLGTINHEKKRKSIKERFKKKKKGLSIEDPLVSFSYAESVRMAATRVHSAMDRIDAKVLLVTSVSENEGKSTVASNLALALAQEEKKVILMDFDFRKPSQYKLFDIENPKDYNFAEYLLGNQELKSLKVGENDSVDLYISYPVKKRMMSQKLIKKMKNIIDELKKDADYIIIDTSPMALISDGEEIASISDASLLVIQQDMMETKYINDTIDQLNRTNAKIIGCVYNNVHKGLFSTSKANGYYGIGYKYKSYYGKRYGKTKE